MEEIKTITRTEQLLLTYLICSGIGMIGSFIITNLAFFYGYCSIFLLSGLMYVGLHKVDKYEKHGYYTNL